MVPIYQVPGVVFWMACELTHHCLNRTALTRLCVFRSAFKVYIPTTLILGLVSARFASSMLRYDLASIMCFLLLFTFYVYGRSLVIHSLYELFISPILVPSASRGVALSIEVISPTSTVHTSLRLAGPKCESYLLLIRFSPQDVYR